MFSSWGSEGEARVAMRREAFKSEQRALLDAQLLEKGKSLDDGMSPLPRSTLRRGRYEAEDTPEQRGGRGTGSAFGSHPSDQSSAFADVQPQNHSPSGRRGYGRALSEITRGATDEVAKAQKRAALVSDLEEQVKEQAAKKLVEKLTVWEEEQRELALMGLAGTGKRRPVIAPELEPFVAAIAPQLMKAAVHTGSSSAGGGGRTGAGGSSSSDPSSRDARLDRILGSVGGSIGAGGQVTAVGLGAIGRGGATLGVGGNRSGASVPLPLMQHSSSSGGYSGGSPAPASAAGAYSSSSPPGASADGTVAELTSVVRQLLEEQRQLRDSLAKAQTGKGAGRGQRYEEEEERRSGRHQREEEEDEEEEQDRYRRAGVKKAVAGGGGGGGGGARGKASGAEDRSSAAATTTTTRRSASAAPARGRGSSNAGVDRDYDDRTGGRAAAAAAARNDRGSRGDAGSSTTRRGLSTAPDSRGQGGLRVDGGRGSGRRYEQEAPPAKPLAPARAQAKKPPFGRSGEGAETAAERRARGEARAREAADARRGALEQFKAAREEEKAVKRAEVVEQKTLRRALPHHRGEVMEAVRQDFERGSPGSNYGSPLQQRGGGRGRAYQEEPSPAPAPATRESYGAGGRRPSLPLDGSSAAARMRAARAVSPMTGDQGGSHGDGYHSHSPHAIMGGDVSAFRANMGGGHRGGGGDLAEELGYVPFELAAESQFVLPKGGGGAQHSGRPSSHGPSVLMGSPGPQQPPAGAPRGGAMAAARARAGGSASAAGGGGGGGGKGVNTAPIRSRLERLAGDGANGGSLPHSHSRYDDSPQPVAVQGGRGGGGGGGSGRGIMALLEGEGPAIASHRY